MGLFDNFRLFFKASPEADAEPFELDDSSFDERRRRDRVNPREGTCVLVIDDSRTITSALKRVLSSIGCVVYEALDAESGLRLVLHKKPELIFLDIVLPGINGFAALRALRRDERTKHIPIIMMSGNEQMTEKFFSSRIGADDFLKKPFSRYEIFARIERLLDGEQIPRRVRVVPETPREATPTPAVAPPVNRPPPANVNHMATNLLGGVPVTDGY
ncbi:MAG: response regulator [Zoogloeaceae bacterium]|jgi:twitching motility two-component system response regulator PilH|nr:response regulator [Zoogloeaceae bacterium]